jgi:hypothetical protein
MNEKAEELKARTKTFALDVLTFTRTLPNLDDVKIWAVSCSGQRQASVQIIALCVVRDRAQSSSPELASHLKRPTSPLSGSKSSSKGI